LRLVFSRFFLILIITDTPSLRSLLAAGATNLLHTPPPLKMATKMAMLAVWALTLAGGVVLIGGVAALTSVRLQCVRFSAWRRHWAGLCFVCWRFCWQALIAVLCLCVLQDAGPIPEPYKLAWTAM
jgi:hypothetical protein